MHYCCLVFTKEFPTDEVLDKVLAPYNDERVYEQPEESRVYPAFTWDWFEVGGRYEGRLQLIVDSQDKKYAKYRLAFCERNPRVGQLFKSMVLESAYKWAKSDMWSFFREEDCFGPLGSRDGYIRVDGAACEDIKNLEEVSCFCAVSCDGNAIAKESYNGHGFDEDAEFDDKLKKMKEAYKDGFVCIVDIHD